MLRKFVFALAVAGAASLPVADAAAAAFGIDGIEVGNGRQMLPVTNAQFIPFFFGGNNFCWYVDGWNGPGWYWCGYAWRQGYGWGGPQGWRGHYYGAGRGPRPGGWGRGPRPGGWGGAPRPGATPWCHPGKGC